ncbi:MAG TPA: HDIG domain-containing protein, partial [Clostridia bacterium]|nr:HDIG domain-containing protein [Clostridia bacterium]
GLRLGINQTAGLIGEDGSALPAVTVGPNGAFSREQFERAASMISRMNMSTWQLTILMNLDAAELGSVYENTRKAVADAMQSTIREGQLETVISNIQRQLINNMSSDLCWNLAIPAVRACLIPNMIVDQEATELNREKARDEVEAVYYKQGQNIVVAGDRVTSHQIGLLSSLGLLQSNEFDSMLYGGVCILVALLMLAFVLYVKQFVPKLLVQPKSLLLIALVFLLTISLSMFAQMIDVYFSPISLGALLIAVLLSPSVAYIFNLVASVCVGLMAGAMDNAFSQQMVNIIVRGILSGTIGIFVIRRKQHRINTLVTGLYIAAANLVSVFALGMITNNDLDAIATDALWSMGGGILASVLSVGLQPALEWAFNLVTPAKLMELANPNHPLMRRLLIETPGTYHHSLMVANLGEAAAEAVGANPLLVRVGAYYHDVGKLKRPQYFKENQHGDNPHDHIDPRVSAAIVLAHVKDGIQIAQRNHLPPPIIDLIRQHHGDTPALYFFHKAREQAGGEDVSIESFRYHEQKPQTKEAAILMLADTVEAAVRAMHDQSPEKIEQTIRTLVKGKLGDGQLDESPLNFRDVNNICMAFTRVLNGVYHQRIEYPSVDIRGDAPVVDSAVLVYPEQQEKKAEAEAEAKAIEQVREEDLI